MKKLSPWLVPVVLLYCTGCASTEKVNVRLDDSKQIVQADESTQIQLVVSVDKKPKNVAGQVYLDGVLIGRLDKGADTLECVMNWRYMCSSRSVLVEFLPKDVTTPCLWRQYVVINSNEPRQRIKFPIHVLPEPSIAVKPSLGISEKTVYAGDSISPKIDTFKRWGVTGNDRLRQEATWSLESGSGWKAGSVSASSPRAWQACHPLPRAVPIRLET